MGLAVDIRSRIGRDFDTHAVDQAETMLGKLAGCRERFRVTRCVVFLAEGDLTKLAHYVQTAMADYRDVIWWAEYDGGEVRLRDCSLPFDPV